MRECDEMSRILRNIGEELEASGITPGPASDKSEMPPLEQINAKLREVEVEIENLKASRTLFEKNHNALEEQSIVLQMGKKFYVGTGSASSELAADRELMSLSEFGVQTSSMLGVIAGTVKTDSVAALERIIFRATRGNAVFQHKPIAQLLLDGAAQRGGPEEVQKSFFMVFFTGGVLGDKVSKISTYFGATLYKYPEAPIEHAEMVLEVEKRIAESTEVLGRARAISHYTLKTAAADFATWGHVVAREKMVFDALNKCAQ